MFFIPPLALSVADSSVRFYRICFLCKTIWRIFCVHIFNHFPWGRGVTHLSDPMPRYLSLARWAIWTSFARKRHSKYRVRWGGRRFAPTGSPFGVKRAGRDRTWASHRGRCRFICKKKWNCSSTICMYFGNGQILPAHGLKLEHMRTLMPKYF